METGNTDLPTIEEIDEALAYAGEAKRLIQDYKSKLIVQGFIDDLLDIRLGAKQ